MSDNKNQHINGMYAILAALIGAFATLGGVLLNDYLDSKKENKKLKTEVQNLNNELNNSKNTIKVTEEKSNDTKTEKQTNLSSASKDNSKPEIKDKSKNSEKENKISKNENLEKKQEKKDLVNSGFFSDIRDGQKYKWVELKDGRKWMAQNLNYKTKNSWCYNNNNANCNKYGRIYTFNAAVKACPRGWKLPSLNDWKIVANYYSGGDYNQHGIEEEVYEALIYGGISEFDVLLAGIKNIDGSFMEVGNWSGFWTSTRRNSNPFDPLDDPVRDDLAHVFFFFNAGNQFSWTLKPEGEGLSCRCIEISEE